MNERRYQIGRRVNKSKPDKVLYTVWDLETEDTIFITDSRDEAVAEMETMEARNRPTYYTCRYTGLQQIDEAQELASVAEEEAEER